VKCWGAVPPAPPGAFTELFIRGNGDCAIRPDGTVSCWSGRGTGPDWPERVLDMDFAFEIGCWVALDHSLGCSYLVPFALPTGQFDKVAVGAKFVCGLAVDKTIHCTADSQFDLTGLPQGTFSQISSGGGLCALRTDGSIACWYIPGTPPSGTFKSVTTGNVHACALRDDDTVACWGGPGPTGTPIESPSGKFREIHSGLYHACGVHTDGSNECWGTSYNGETVIPGGVFSEIEQDCARRPDGSVSCWGSNLYSSAEAPPGEFSRIFPTIPSCGLRPDHSLECWGWLESAPKPPSGTFITYSQRGGFGCGVREDHEIACTGTSYDGSSPPPGPFVDVAIVQGNRACAIRPTGELVCWAGASIATQDQFVALATNAAGLCGIRKNGTLACWGESIAEPPPGLVSSVSIGDQHACAQRPDQTVICWGDNQYGQLAVPSGPVLAITAGGGFTCTLELDGSEVCWGGLTR
jgi:hypothetical protein